VKQLTALALCLATVVGTAQAQTTVLTLLTPTPIGIALSVGRWIVADNQKIYYIEVAGQGANEEQARLNGFRLAVEQAVGSLIASETEVRNGRLKRDEIISYASGYVTQYEIINTEPKDNRVQVKMKVWVGRNALANRLLNESKQAGDIDGPNGSAAISTIQYEKSQGDRLVQTVLNDFPRRAFDVELKNSRVSLDSYRNGRLSIPFQIRWNYDYLVSLWIALEATSQPKAHSQNFVRVSSRASWAGEAGYADGYRVKQLAQELVGSGPSVQLTIKSLSGQLIHRQCYRWAELDHDVRYQYPRAFFVDFPSTNRASINGRAVLDAKIDLPIHPKELENLGNFELAVVRKQDCK
jgi:hypothetical protein